MGMPVKKIATDVGVSRNAVYQTIDRLRRQGALPETYTPSGQPPRRLPAGPPSTGSAFGPTTLAPQRSRLARLRELAGDRADEVARAEAIEAAIASSDAVALAYELGRADEAGRDDMAGRLAEAALRRLGALGANENSETRGPENQ
jgi:hypothetical protein